MKIEKLLDGLKDQISDIELKEGREKAVVKLFNGGKIIVYGKENVIFIRKNYTVD